VARASAGRQKTSQTRSSEKAATIVCLHARRLGGGRPAPAMPHAGNGWSRQLATHGRRAARSVFKCSPSRESALEIHSADDVEFIRQAARGNERARVAPICKFTRFL
jgi:hypothetical protein